MIVACGTSYHAGLVGRYAIEEWARVPVEMDIASEYRYRNPVVGPGDLVIGITQSGETADTLAAMRLARERGAKVLAITNVMGSQATRDADAVLFTRAGLEVGVAATKTFVAQVAAMYLLGLRLAELRGTLSAGAHHRAGRRAQAAALEDRGDARRRARSAVREVAAAHHDQSFFLYLGRHIGLPVCLEGALKLKEISYIPTDAYAAGEMKHGPIALLDESTPVVCVATDSPVLDKVLSNIEEVRARGADDDRDRHRGRRERRRGRRADDRGRPHRLDAAADPRGHPAAAARLRHRPPPRPQRRPAAQPGQDGHRRVTGGDLWPPAYGIDLLEIERLERALERHPRLAERLFTEDERAYAAARARPGRHLAARFAAKEAVVKALGLSGGFGLREVEVVAGEPPDGAALGPRRRGGGAASGSRSR